MKHISAKHPPPPPTPTHLRPLLTHLLPPPLLRSPYPCGPNFGALFFLPFHFNDYQDGSCLGEEKKKGDLRFPHFTYNIIAPEQPKKKKKKDEEEQKINKEYPDRERWLTAIVAI